LLGRSQQKLKTDFISDYQNIVSAVQTVAPYFQDLSLLCAKYQSAGIAGSQEKDF
jgi:hypothetical protein